MPDPVVVDLADAADAYSVGAKAANLARLLASGLPVPDGFVVTSAACASHLESLSAAIAPLLSALPARLPDLRRAIVSAHLAPQTAAAIRAAFSELGARSVAVRSSGTAEDLPGHSFAGQYDTFLQDADAETCLLLVKQCWASLWTDRAFDYRVRNGFDHCRASMAVLVQRLVRADAAGVCFTADPLSGRRDRVVVEAVRGLGDKLVSGAANPDRFALDSGRLRVTSRAAAASPALSDRACRSVARLALRCQQLFGSPQDVEWAVERGRLFLLQSRPITALPDPPSWEDRQVWSTTNAAEVLPGVLTPMVWSTVGEFVGELLGGIVGRIGISLGEHPLFDNVAGRIYMNLCTFTGLVRRMPFAGRMNQAQMFGGRSLSPKQRSALDLSPDDLPDIKVSPLKTLIKLPGFLLWIMRHGPKRGRAWIDSARAAYEAKPRPDLGRYSEAELCSRSVATLGQLGVGGEGLGYALAGMMLSSVLYDLNRRWFNDPNGVNPSRLLAGTGELQSAEAGLDLWRLVRSAPAETRPLLLSSSPWREVRPNLEATGAGQDFLARWDRFLHKHGHHARGEMDIYNPRWRETPDYILEVVRNYLRAEGKADPEADQRRHAEERERARQELLGRLRNPLKRTLFGYIVKQAQLSAAIRENVKDAAIRVLADTRELLVELERRLVARGVLAHSGDIFFLRIEEVEPAVTGAAGFDTRGTVTRRRAEHERNRSLNPPAIIIGRYDPEKHKPDVIDSSARVLPGLAVSVGRATGPARVVLFADPDVQVLPGEILVAPFTDPGWTPYFVPAAGIVMDQGGLMSHGSIVAREYGIPAVVNVGPATKLIKTGQLVEVDGNQGVVRLLDT